MKSIPNALRWPILLLSLALGSLVLSGCETKPIKVDSQPREKVPLNTPMPETLSVTPIQWMVLTPQNIEEVWAKLSKNNQPVVIIAITPEGYKELSLNLSDIRRLVSEQREIIIQYKQYYEPQVKENANSTK